MADSEEWFVGEDGCLSVGKSTVDVTYHSTLNTILVTTKEPALRVLDVTSGSLLQISDLSAGKLEQIRCQYLSNKDKVLFSSGQSVCIRKDLNGVLLLDTALQASATRTEDVVKVELPLPEANHLFKCLMSAELPGVDFVEDVLRELEREIEIVQQATKQNHKVAKWATVTLNLPHCALKSVCGNLVIELKRLHQNVPGLPVASAVNDRLTYLLQSSQSDNSSSPVERSLMFSEGARRETFAKWPHMNYKWALPDPMAQAGFYHQPSSTGDDRAMCFTCNVCLVCWEPTDEPWSEHERHSPQCPFVKGEYTQNVPMSVTFATEPAHQHSCQGEKVECVSTITSNEYFATSSLHGNVVVWNMSRQVKKHIQFNIDPWEPIIAAKTGSHLTVLEEPSQPATGGQQVPVAVVEAWQDGSDQNKPGSSSSLDTNTMESLSGEGSEKMESKVEIIEVGGAWKSSATNVIENVVEISLEDMEPVQEPFSRSRPSQDILVSSVCVLGPPKSSESQPNTPSVIPSTSGVQGGKIEVHDSHPHIQPCLVSGVAIRRNTLSINDVHIMSGSTAKTSEETKIEVQAMNQVNQAISDDPQLISDIAADISAGASSSGLQKVNPFVPYLLVHDISSLKTSGGKEWKNRLVTTSKDMPIIASGSKTLVSTVQDIYVSQMSSSEEDPDVQIIGVTPPPGENLGPQFGNVPSLVPSKEEGDGQNQGSEPGKRGSSPSLSSLAKWTLHKEGRVVQCIDLPQQVGCDQYVSSIVPTLDGKYVVVVTLPRGLNKKMEILSGNGIGNKTAVGLNINQSESAASDGPNIADPSRESNMEGLHAQSSTGGCLLVYKLQTFSDMVVLEEKPCRVCVIEDIGDAVIHLLMLPTEVAQATEEEEEMGGRADTPTPHHSDPQGAGPVYSGADLQGYVAASTQRGDIKILQLTDFKVLATIQAPEDDKFISTTYCTGIDRLCCCSKEGKLQFYIVGPRHCHQEEYEMGLASKVGTVGTSSMDDVDLAVEHAAKAEELLVQQPLTTEVLCAIHDLTQFENLLPRFSATVPPCWNEIQQEQQQRRHPQHLHQQGEAMQHTRTWRLQQDNTSWDEHLFELVLPKPCCVGHLDVKFTLHPLCSNAPNIQVTLLKQSISNIGRGGLSNEAPKASTAEVDTKIDFKMPASEGGDSVGRQSDEVKASGINQVLSPEFLDRHGAEVVCGPVDLAHFVDLSNHSGVISLTSPQVLKVKSKSFLLHFKAMPSNDKSVPEKPVKVSKTTKESLKSKVKEKGAKDPLGFIPTATERLSASAVKQKLENVKGCDWIQEISITVRKSKKTPVPRDRLQRSAMLEMKSFHERLLQLVCSQDELVLCTTSHEHQQKLALDILSWITAIQMNDVGKSMETCCMVTTVQSNLNALVKACFLEGGRCIAHQCAKVISLCLEYSKNASDPHLTAAFSCSLLQALLDCLPLVSSARSAGALHWYFTLLNRVKCMDISQTSQRCSEILTIVARNYHERTNPWHSMLKARFGLYGHPMEPEIFDLDPPTLSKATSTPIGPVQIPSTYAGVLGGGTSVGSSSNSMGGSSQGLDVADFQDLMSLCSNERNASAISFKSQGVHLAQHVFGLLEVEPLHFTCHATSDGTRMERMDNGGATPSVTSGVAGLSGTINFGESLSNAAGAALASLSTAMASAEHQLQQLQQKQLQLFKLQQQKQKLEQKLAETSKNPSGSTTSGSTFVPYSSELFPPTPKNTPFFMTPPVTPPNESYQNIYIGPDNDPGKPPTGKTAKAGKGEGQGKSTLPWPQGHNLFQHPPQQALVVERMHSGARRFVVLDFGHPILLTDLVIPSCTELASLSIDIWIQGEEVDGERLVVSADIGLRSLIMNNIMPPPICRYLKITTIGRYGGSTTRSKIPIGSFYGHTFILPWECKQLPNLPGGSSSVESLPVITSSDQSQIVSQLGMYVSMLEDIQCRYSLACNRLVTLLSSVDMPQNSSNNQYYLKKMKKGEEESKVLQAYQDCILLQLQWNLAQRAIDRVQCALGLKLSTLPANEQAGLALLKKSSTDKLRVLTELLLDTLLSMTLVSPTIPQIPLSLYKAFSPQMCESLFHNLCITGTRKMQIHAGMLLVRICGGQGWWGDFLGNILQEFFSSGQSAVFPQDRVFILLTVLGQKALSGSSSSEVLESMLMLLARLLFPLLNTQQQYTRSNAAMLDLSLIGWLLLFLSKNLDIVSAGNIDEGDKSSMSKDKSDGMSSNRWDFIQGDTAMQNIRSSKSMASKLYKRKIQKRLMHHKQQFLELQQAKKSFLLAQADKAAGAMMNKDAEAIFKKPEWMFMKLHKQYESKHFKDIMNIRRTDGEVLRKMPKDTNSGGESNGSDMDPETSLVVSRDKCIPVVRGLMALLLSMDFTCNVDLFIVACKVVARITSIARPAITLSEVMSQEELEKLIMLTCSIEYNHGNIAWGGSWAGHSVTCLLLDILDGEKMYSFGLPPEGMTDDDVSASMTETDDSLQNSVTLSTLEDDSTISEGATSGETSQLQNGKDKYKFDKASSLIVDMLLDDEEYDDVTNTKLQEYFTGESMLKPEMPPALEWACPVGMGISQPVGSSAAQVINVQPVSGSSGGTGTINWGPPSVHQMNIKSLNELLKNKYAGDDYFSNKYIIPVHPTIGSDEKKTKLKSKLASYVASKANAQPQGVSTAMDSRLENGVELNAELRLKVMLSLEADIVMNAISAPLPPTLPGMGHSVKVTHPPTDDEQISAASLLSTLSLQQIKPSSDMLSVCFNNMFSQLQFQRINLDNLLMTWLTLNDDTNQEENGQTAFDPSRIPSIPLNGTAVSSLLTALAWTPAIPTRTWVLALQTLTLLANLKTSDSTSGTSEPEPSPSEAWLATIMVADTNMMTVLVKFLSATSPNGPTMLTNQCSQIGPTAVRAFNEFLVRLQLRCAEENEIHLKELLLKLVYTLTSDRGAFHNCQGPLDAQCKLLEHMLNQSYEGMDINNAISVIDSIVLLVHHHITSQERVLCKSSTENFVSARACFGGLFASMMRTGDTKSMMGEGSKDLLMCNLLKLVNLLIQIPLPGRQQRRSNLPSGSRMGEDMAEGGVATPTSESTLTDLSKITQSLGAGGIITSTPNPEQPKSDEQKSSETDEQKSTSVPKREPKSCSHFSDVRNPDAEQKDPLLTDIILGHRQIMIHLIQALSYCNSNTMAMILGSGGLQGSMQDSFTGIDPLSVGDAMFQIMCTLNKKGSELRLILKPIHDYLSSGFQGVRQAGISRLSEPLLWYILRVLDCQYAIKIFLDMGGIEVLCHNLVNSNRRVINTSPSLISTMMQFLGANKSLPSVAKRGNESENAEGLQNFAPYASISSTSPTAGPADVLIQSSPPHRRARSAAWSYHFYPEEAWVDLTISLPCAVLLKEVHIQPHLTSLSTCPAAVSLEVSRDGSTMVPVSTPIVTSGLTCIKIQLLKAEVASNVTVRLHKPRDSQTIGLSQILLMGSTAFGDQGSMKSSNIFTPTEDYVSRTSIGWLRLLHHCLTQCEETGDCVAEAASPTPNLLVTCTALLVSPSSIVYAANIEAVLLKIGLHSTEMGLSLIDHLLRNSLGASGNTENGLPLHGKINGMANDSTVDILYQLGIHQDSSTASRIKALTNWLGDSARVALQKHHGGYPEEGYRPLPGHAGTIDLPAPAPAHVHCVAAILWQSRELAVTYNLKAINTPDILSSMYEWSSVLPFESSLKKAVDSVICSMCYIHPEYFATVMEWLGIVNPNISYDLSSAAVTDDRKDSQQQNQHSLEPMTDDLKADPEARARLAGSDRELISASSIPPIMLQEFSHLVLDESHLSTLATTCQSEDALQQLLDSGFVAVLCQGVYEFCCRELLRHNEGMPTMGGDGVSGASSPHSPPSAGSSRQSPSNTARTSSESSVTEKGMVVTADLVGPVLMFLAEVAKEVGMKDWLGGAEGSVFWPLLLRLLCTTPSHVISTELMPSLTDHRVMSGQQRAAVESATVEFFSSVLACHTDNQRTFATVLCDVIRGNGANSLGLGYTNSPLSGFLRRLFLQVLLEDEKILVCFKSTSQLYKGQSNALSTVIQHPRCGAGHKYRALQVSLNSTCGDVLSKVSDTPSLTSQILEDKDGKLAEEMKKDTSELGIEVVDQISAVAGLQAKEKREKSKTPTPPPRPPSRRGVRPPETGTVHIPILSLFHPLMAGQPLPSELTLSQLLGLLHDRGLAQGMASLDFTMKLRTKKMNLQRGEKRLKTDQDTLRHELYADDSDVELIPDEVLLDNPSFPSALQVFASVGGLALLAEHLPLLYPEVTRQVTPLEVSKDSNTSLGHDWVNVESAEDIYEEIYEPPMPSSTQPQSKQPSATLPSIPPHSLVAFGLFLRLPGYAEVLLKEKKRAQCLLRLVLGVTDDGEGGHILTSPVAGALPTLPFNVLKTLFDTTPVSTDDGVLLRRMTLDIGAVHLILACLSVLSHHAPRQPIPGFHQEIIQAATQAAAALASNNNNSSSTASSKLVEGKGQNYWARGTGFGTGSTASSWDAEQALLRQKAEEEHVTCLLQVLASCVNPGGTVASDFVQDSFLDLDETEGNGLPLALPDLLSQSCLVPAISSYLRNDSVLDMARHVPLYRSLLELLRGIAVCPVLVPLLLPLDKDDDSIASVSSLLDKMKSCVDTYASRLKSNKNKSKPRADDEESEGLALLIPDIQDTAGVVDAAIHRVREKSADNCDDNGLMEVEGATKMDHSEEQKYMAVMKELQFDTFEMVADEDGVLKFSVPHHYESNVKAAGDVNNAGRARRLAQEAVTLSTSLPLSASSSVFVRCDEERLDVMKVLITGPSDTPYANGSFEFDVYFPQDYPHSPPLINMETTGNHTVRFNPNLYNDGKVCLSILNTWHGRPEEKWNSQTSSFLQVLVSIQSLILVSEPYFNEPGYERSRGTPSGQASSREYDANIRQATVKWAMLEMVRNPPTCFKEVIDRHFWMKKHELSRQIEEWIAEMEAYTTDKRVGRTISHSLVALKRHYSQLKEEFAKLKAPSDFEDDDEDTPTPEQNGPVSNGNGVISSPSSTSSLANTKVAANKSENTLTVNNVPAAKGPHSAMVWQGSTSDSTTGDSSTGSSSTDSDSNMAGNISESSGPLMMSLPMNHDGGINNNNSAEGLIPNGNAEEDDTDW